MNVSLRTVEHVPWKRGVRLLIRIDGDVTIKGKRIADDFRIEQAVPTIKEALRHGAHVRIISHRGRPHGVRVASLTQRPVAAHLSKLLKRDIVFVKDPLSEITLSTLDSSPHILFFENIRFWGGEEKNDTFFAKKLARWGDIYVNDAFANSHREHASMVALARMLPSYAGFHLEKEILNLSRMVTSPDHPFVAILGGAKLETKIPLIKRFLTLTDHVLIGGAIANTLLAAQGFSVGKSLVDKDIGNITDLLSHKKLHLPSDVVVTKNLSRVSGVHSCAVSDVASNEYIVDIGPDTVTFFSSIIKTSSMVVWNGPMGFAEVPSFANGTKHLASSMRRLPAFKLIGGGDTVTLLHAYGALRGFSYVSTGGGAMLEFLAGAHMPAIDVLRGSLS